MAAAGSLFATIALLAAPMALAIDTDSFESRRIEGLLKPNPERPPITGSCTIAVPPMRATVEVQIANAADFCELVSQALTGDVFHAPVIVTPGWLWHYADAALACRLRYRNTRYRMTIRNSTAACRWFTRLTTNWHRG